MDNRTYACSEMYREISKPIHSFGGIKYLLMDADDYWVNEWFEQGIPPNTSRGKLIVYFWGMILDNVPFLFDDQYFVAKSDSGLKIYGLKGQSRRLWNCYPTPMDITYVEKRGILSFSKSAKSRKRTFIVEDDELGSYESYEMEPNCYNIYLELKNKRQTKKIAKAVGNWWALNESLKQASEPQEMYEILKKSLKLDETQIRKMLEERNRFLISRGYKGSLRLKKKDSSTKSKKSKKQCTYCGKKGLSPRAPICPNCGEPLSKK